jgi:hypothetical protein
MMAAMRLAFVGVCLLAGCASGGFPDVTDPRELSSSFGAPHISRIRDAGGVRVPVQGAWKGEEDGVAVPGELLFIEGDNFGRQPTVSIGGRATTIVARTDGGGIVARVPKGAPVGDVEVAVSQPKGRDSKAVKVRRFAVVAHGDQVYVLDINKDGFHALAQPLVVAGARRVALSNDGAAAYVLASSPAGDRVVVIDLAAPGGPRVIGERKLTHRAQFLVAAEDAPVLAALGEGKLTLFALPVARQPAPWDAVALPPSKGPPRAVQLSPDGKLLALLQPEGNKLLLFDVERPPQAKPVTTLDILPDQRLPLVHDLFFSTDGETLWVVSGDNTESLPALEPTRLTAVRLVFAEAQKEAEKTAAEGAPPPQKVGSRLLSVWRTNSIPGGAAPVRMTVARGQPLASGTTIRMPPEKAAVFVTCVNDVLFKLAKLDLSTAAGQKAALELWKPPQPGMMVRADINGGGGPMFATREILSAVELTPDTRWVVATAARFGQFTGSPVFEFGVTVSPIWGAPQPEFIPLGPLRAGELKPPFEIGDVKIQP